MWYVWFGKKILPFLKYGGVILLGLIVVLSFAQNLPIPGNFKSLVVMSGSMTPKIPVGSVAIVKPAADIKVGDIVTFKDPREPKNLITHRIVEIGENEIIKTKGDANNAPDNWEVRKGDVVGKFLFSVPLLGYAVDFAKRPPGFLLLILLPAILIIVNEIWAIKSEFAKTKSVAEDKDANSLILSSMKEKGQLVVAAVSAVLLALAFSSGRTLALLSDTETSSGNTITVGVWDSVGDVVINELMWMGSFSSSDDEWIELKNTTSHEIDLSGWQITKWVAGTHEELILTIPNGKKIPANGYFLISNSDKATSKINVEPDLVDSSVVLVNNDLQIKLYDGTWNGGATLIDTADDGTGGPAAGDNSNKFSMERNDTPGDGTQAANWHNCLDSSSTGLYWDAGATERGTPGAANLSENDPSVQRSILLNCDEEEESSTDVVADMVEMPQVNLEPDGSGNVPPPEASESAKPAEPNEPKESNEPDTPSEPSEASESAQPVEGE